MARCERSRNYESLVLQAVAHKGQESVAAFMSTSEATVSRITNERLPQFCDYLVALELKIVPVKYKCYKPEDIRALMHFAKERVNQLESPDQLVWDPQ